MQLDSIMYLPGLKDAKVTGMEKQPDGMDIHVEMEICPHECPKCGSWTQKVHDYRIRRIGHLKLFERMTRLVYNRRRYVCRKCGKRFSERNPFVGRYQRFSVEWNQAVGLRSVKVKTFKEAAVSFGTSASTITRRFDALAASVMKEPGKLPKAIAIDEYKGDTRAGKYQVVIANAETREPIDILPDRRLKTVEDYLRKHGEKVEVVVMDMSHTFKSAVRKALDKPVIVADRFHFVRYVHWALERVRIRVQKDFSDYDRKRCKKKRRVFHKDSGKLSDEERKILDRYLKMHPDLRTAYDLKETFKQWFKKAKSVGQKKIARVKKALHHFYGLIESAGLTEFKKTRSTLQNWETEILNSFVFGYSNGFLEAINNTTKVLKRNAYGYRNFNRMRARILLSYEYKDLEIHVA